jgi:hypothetical protein
MTIKPPQRLGPPQWTLMVVNSPRIERRSLAGRPSLRSSNLRRGLVHRVDFDEGKLARYSTAPSLACSNLRRGLVRRLRSCQARRPASVRRHSLQVRTWSPLLYCGLEAGVRCAFSATRRGAPAWARSAAARSALRHGSPAGSRSEIGFWFRLLAWARGAAACGGCGAPQRGARRFHGSPAGSRSAAQFH